MKSPTAKQVRLWYRIHKWTSLVCTAFLLMSCVTGLPLIFGDEIERWTDTGLKPAALPASAPLAQVDPMIAEAHRHYPGEQIIGVGWDDDSPRIFVNIAPDFRPETKESHSFVFDAHTGRLLKEEGTETGPMRVFTMLHIELYAGLPGELLLGGMALLFVVSLLSGALVYGPFMRRLEFGTVRTSGATRTRWFDLHNLLGIVTLTWGLVVGVTGAINTLSTPLFGLWRAQALPALLEPYRGKPVPTHFGSVDLAVKRAQEALPGMQLASVLFPNDVSGSPQHFVVWTRGSTAITSRLFTPALVDAVTDRVVSAQPLPWYLRALEVSRPLHFGDYGGLPLKVLWALFDVALIAVLGSGVYLWLSRRKTPVEDELDRLVDSEAVLAATSGREALQ